jgi:hypothetical protein
MTLASVNHSAIIPASGIHGADQLDGAHLSMPRVKIVQPTSQVDGGQPGQFFNTLLGEGADQMTVIPLRVQFGRVLFDKDDLQGGAKCASDDGAQARPAGVLYPGRLCAECPLSEWSENDRGQRIPPACAFTYNYILADEALDGMPVQISFMKTAVPAARQLNTLIKAFGTSRRIILGTKEVRSDRGRYWVPVIRDGGALEKEQAAYYRQMAAGMGGVALATEAETEAAPPPEYRTPAGPPPDHWPPETTPHQSDPGARTHDEEVQYAHTLAKKAGGAYLRKEFGKMTPAMLSREVQRMEMYLQTQSGIDDEMLPF